MDKIWIVVGAIIVAAALIGGHYTVAGYQVGALVVDRFTGAAWNCLGTSCHPVEYSK